MLYYGQRNMSKIHFHFHAFLIKIWMLNHNTRVEWVVSCTCYQRSLSVNQDYKMRPLAFPISSFSPSLSQVSQFFLYWRTWFIYTFVHTFVYLSLSSHHLIFILLWAAMPIPSKWMKIFFLRGSEKGEEFW